MLLVVLVPAVAAGPVEDVLEGVRDEPIPGGGFFDDEDPAPEPPPAPSEPESSIPGANPDPATVARPAGTRGPASAPSTSAESSSVDALFPPAFQQPGRSFRIVTPVRPVGNELPAPLPSPEPFGLVLAAAILLLVGASAGHAWAQASGRLDAVI